MATIGDVPSPEFSVIGGKEVQQVLRGREPVVMSLIEQAYRLHGADQTVNPPSYFLRTKDRPSSRIIALPASVQGDVRVDGLKWISSFPENVASGLPRASAVIILNDYQNGYPFACLEGSIISASRTAASAALAADWLSRDRGRPTTIGLFGTGLIARYILDYLTSAGWQFKQIGLYDLDERHAAGFAQYLADENVGGHVVIQDAPEQLIRQADLIVFATVAPVPHVSEPELFSHCPLVLEISLRDLAPRVITSAVNVVDDIDHCLNAGTSVHLAAQFTGGREFLAGTLTDVMNGSISLDRDRPAIFSPFGLGVLDLVLSKYVYDELKLQKRLSIMDDFFVDLNRYRRSTSL
jgi:N-[(2S)-2-amino-2-carboxyethyl]-L-glutamate dehydrogenase